MSHDLADFGLSTRLGEPPRTLAAWVGYHDLGAGYYDERTNKQKKVRNHIRQLEALGYAVTLAPCRMTSPHAQTDRACLRAWVRCRALSWGR